MFRKRIKSLFQTQPSECGLVCCLMLMEYHGHSVDIFSLREQYPMNTLQGATFLDLCRILKEYGLESRAVRLEVDEISQLRLPAIIHWNMNHAVIIERITRHSIDIVDPSQGRYSVDFQSFSRQFTGMALEVFHTASLQRIKKKSQKAYSLADFFSLLEPLKYGLFGVILLSCFNEIADYFRDTVCPKLLFDHALYHRDWELLQRLFCCMLLLLLLQTLLEATMFFIEEKLLYNFSAVMLHFLSTKFARLPMEFFQQRSAADISQKSEAVQRLKAFMIEDTISVVTSALMGTLALVALVAVYPFRLTWIIFASVSGDALIQLFTHRKQRQLLVNSLYREMSAKNLLLEIVRGMRSLKSMNSTEFFCDRWMHKEILSLNAQYHAATYAYMRQALCSTVSAVEKLCLSFFAYQQYLSDERFKLGCLYALLRYRSLFINNVGFLITYVNKFRLISVYLDRLNDLLTQREEPLSQALSASSLRRFNGSPDQNVCLQLQNLTYRYPGMQKPLIENMNLTVGSGETIAIFGASGCGKSTVLQLILGLILPQEGTVRIGGLHTVAGDMSPLRTLIAGILQEDTLFYGTVLDNIAGFSGEKNLERAIYAAKKASIHQDIVQMPMGYFSVVGGFLSNLSVGQKERIFIARALYQEPKLLLLDESTSQLDQATEERIHTTLATLPITRIYVSHRENISKYVDRSFELLNGKLVLATGMGNCAAPQTRSAKCPSV